MKMRLRLYYFSISTLSYHPNSLSPQKPYINERILKLKEFQNNPDKYLAVKVYAGYTIPERGLLRELSLSQFTFQTLEQWEKWNSQHESLKRKHGQSFEMFYRDVDGNLNFLEMITEIYQAIKDGLLPKDMKQWKGYDDHPHMRTIQAVEDMVSTLYGE